MEFDDDSIKVRLIGDNNHHLELECGSAAFRRIWKVIQEEAELDDFAELPIDSLKWIGITNRGILPQQPSQSWLRDHIALLGCGVVSAIVLTVFMVGILTIAGLIQVPR
jgi:hypothetical protein